MEAEPNSGELGRQAPPSKGRGGLQESVCLGGGGIAARIQGAGQVPLPRRPTNLHEEQLLRRRKGKGGSSLAAALSKGALRFPLLRSAIPSAP